MASGTLTKGQCAVFNLLERKVKTSQIASNKKKAIYSLNQVKDDKWTFQDQSV